MQVMSTRPSRMRAGSGMAEARPASHRRGLAGTDGPPDPEQPAGGAPGGIHADEAGHDPLRLAEFGHRGLGGEIRCQALPELGLVRSAKPSASSSTIGAGSWAARTSR